MNVLDSASTTVGFTIVRAACIHYRAVGREGKAMIKLVVKNDGTIAGDVACITVQLQCYYTITTSTGYEKMAHVVEDKVSKSCEIIKKAG